MLAAIHQFLSCPTPPAWTQWALQNQEILLIDHANCEKKAAATAMNLLYRHVACTELLKKMSQLAREELLHFQQVVELMAARNISYRQLSASRYASSLREKIRKDHLGMLVDTLIVGAFVEARSCERFAALLPHLDTELARFYRSLLRSEARHFEDYLMLARLYAQGDISARINLFAEIERELIESEDQEFRFHSGVPVSS
ncbi:MAG: tRNA isopentenyl-2-thiomethyl-A-37 hydroxylase MiaE [Pseudomonadales bacterium]|nr:tRNA isopentenyl-2-thiomethyl-A-37 hydroxylase MiaE [Pseudomonadales bacterium]